MKIRDIFNAKAIALRQTTVASNKQAYLGSIFFPSMKKMGLDLSWIKTSKGLPVSLMPSNFDSKSTIRSREGFKLEKTQMAFFRESFLVTEEDEQEIMRVQDAADPYAQPVLAHIYNDADNLVEGARVVPERMIWQLLAPETGTPQILIEANGVVYAYNYDPTGTFAANNFEQLLGSDMWSDTENSNPVEDVREAQDAIETATGDKPAIGVLSKKTMGYLLKNQALKSAILAQNQSANIFMTQARVKAFFLAELDLNLIVYTKQFKNEAGVASKFYPDGYITLVPNGELGNTWYGTTPEERTLMGDPTADVALVDGAIAVAVTTTSDPVNTKTTASEIVLPSFERMDSVYVIKVHTDVEKLEGTVAEGSSSGTTKVTLGSAGTGNSYAYNTSASKVPAYGSAPSGYTAYTSGADITVADGTDFVIVKLNSDGLVIAGGVFTADSKA